MWSIRYPRPAGRAHRECSSSSPIATTSASWPGGLRRRGYRVTTADSGPVRHRRALSLPDRPRARRTRHAAASAASSLPARSAGMQWNVIPVMLITGKSDADGAVQRLSPRRRRRHPEAVPFRSADRAHRSAHRTRAGVQAPADDNAALDARVVERAIQIGELREQLARVRRGSMRLELALRQAAREAVPDQVRDDRNSSIAGATSCASKAIARLAITKPAALPQS